MRISLDRVSHRYGDGPWLFRDISHHLDLGSMTAVTGPSGSGKSTLLAILAGWLKPSMGSISMPSGSGRTNWVFQAPFGVPTRTALDHVILPLLARGQPRSAAERHALSILATFGLGDQAEQRYATLSGGQTQRLMLARAVAAQPFLLLADEPTAQLDPTSSLEVISALRHLADAGRVVVIATHDQRVIDTCPDQLHLGAP